MQSSDARILRGGAIPTGLAAVPAVLLSLLVAGPEGALGAAVGGVVVIGFFAVSVFVVSYISNISPQLMMGAALVSYFVKLAVMFGLVVGLSGVSAWNPRAFAWTVIALTLVWLIGETRASLGMRVIELAPGKEPAKPADLQADQSV